jgi:PII-like signaling protein
MYPVKKVEVIVNTALEQRLLPRLLERMQVAGYSVLRNVTGMGPTGRQEGDLLVDVEENSYVIIFIEPERLEALVDAIRPVIRQYGGQCVVSDAVAVRGDQNP